MSEAHKESNNLAQTIPARDWQPIETAPKELWVLILHGDGSAVDRACCEEGIWVDTYDEPVYPTHWMPLPDPPVASRRSGERRQEDEKKDGGTSLTAGAAVSVSAAPREVRKSADGLCPTDGRLCIELSACDDRCWLTGSVSVVEGEASGPNAQERSEIINPSLPNSLPQTAITSARDVLDDAIQDLCEVRANCSFTPFTQARLNKDAAIDALIFAVHQADQETIRRLEKERDTEADRVYQGVFDYLWSRGHTHLIHPEGEDSADPVDWLRHIIDQVVGHEREQAEETIRQLTEAHERVKKESGAALLPVDPSASPASTEALPDRHERWCQLSDWDGRSNDPRPICTCDDDGREAQDNTPSKGPFV